MEILNSRLRRALKNEKIITRASGSLGIWLAFLLPIAVIISCVKTDVSDIYKLSAIYSCNSLLNVFYLLFNIFIFDSINILDKGNLVYGILLSIIVDIYFFFSKLGFLKIFCYAVSNSLLYFEGVLFLLKKFPNSFTFGEVNLAVQGLSLFIFNVFVVLNKTLLKEIPNNEFDISGVILLVGLFWVLFFCVSLYFLKNDKTVTFYFLGLSIFSMIYLSIYYVLNINCFYWLWQYFTKPERIPIIFLWVFCSALAVIIVQHHIQINKKSNTMIRKYFHGLIVVVYLTGIFIDRNLLYFSSGCVLGLFIILEVFRKMNIPPLNHFLTLGFLIYYDEKDSNNLALTPFCLLIGHSLPLWLNPFQTYSNEIYLPLLSGVLSVGIGDTFASIGGKLFGRYKYKNSNKTVEGTIFCILSQLLLLQLLNYLEFLYMSFGIFCKSFIIICFTSVLEAKTDQIDNIVLPLVMYILFMM